MKIKPNRNERGKLKVDIRIYCVSECFVMLVSSENY